MGTHKKTEKKKDRKDKGEKRSKQATRPRQDSDLPLIDTQGKPLRLAAGGSLTFQCVEVRDAAKKPEKWQLVLFTGGKKGKELEETEEKTNSFDNPTEVLQLAEDVEELRVVLNEKALIGHSYKGEVRIAVDDLMDGYPRDDWFDLVNKPGKKNDKIKGQLHLQVLYLAPNETRQHDEFKHPLHSLILKKRLDIFQRKVDDVEKKVDSLDEEGLTPLLLAASRGQTAFVKVLVENGAKVGFRDAKGMTALHHAALGGHVDVINYLSRLDGVELDSADDSDNGSTPLHLAAEQNHGDAIEMLWKRHANVDVKNAKGNTPLCVALAVQSGAASAVKALVAAGADIYAKNKEDLTAWEISQRKDICYSSTTRAAFMKACDVVDWREFELSEKFSNKQRFTGDNLSSDWKSSDQFKFSVKKDLKVNVLVYSEKREEGCEKKVSGCIIRHDPRATEALSFQQEGIGFAAGKQFEFNMEPEFEYTIVSFTSAESLEGKFGICIFSNDAQGVEMVVPEKHKHVAEVAGKWKGSTAAGSAKPLKNPLYLLSVEGSGEVEVTIMLSQAVKDVGGALFGDSGARITPTKHHIGYFLYDKTCNKELAQTPHWLNAVDVHSTFKLKAGKQYTIIPTTQKENEELSFKLLVASQHKVALASKKSK